MTGAMQGADVGQLRATAKLFESQASEIDQYRVSVSKGVEASAWIGPFAVKWRAMWQAEDSRYLQETVDMLRDIVKQLHTQADQQERASSAGADTSLGSAGLGLAGLAALKAAEDRDQGAAGGEKGKPDVKGKVGSGGVGSLPKFDSDEGEKRYYAKMGNPASGAYGDGQVPDGLGGFKGQCTSWAAFRRQELGLTHNGPQGNTGHGAEMADLILAKEGKKALDKPVLGAVVSDKSGVWGHVMVVEEILSEDPPRFRVSEMNYDRDGHATALGQINTNRTWTKAPGGWKDDQTGAIHQFTIAP